jgi:hypothetical protein
MAYAILATGAAVELHIGSEDQMQPEVNKAIKLADETLLVTAPHKIHFHGIKGISQFQAMMRPEAGIAQAWELPLPNFANAARFMRQFSYGASECSVASSYNSNTFTKNHVLSAVYNLEYCRRGATFETGSGQMAVHSYQFLKPCSAVFQ